MGTHNINEVLERRRYARFCGRMDELAQLNEFADQKPPRVLHLYGPGGIGKTLLLDYWMRLRRMDDARTLRIEAAGVACTREAIAAAFEPLRRADNPFDWVVVDDYHHWDNLENFMRDSIFGALPGHVHLLVVGRRYPATGWITDAGWQTVTNFLRLPPLPEEDAETLLNRLDAPSTRQRGLLRLCAGNPLALTLAASLTIAGGQGESEDLVAQHISADEGQTTGSGANEAPTTDVPLSPPVLRSFVSEIMAVVSPSQLTELQWEALAVGALAGYVDETMLRSLHDRPNVVETVAWLRRLSVVESTNAGLKLNEFSRRAILLQSRFETPQRLIDLAAACADEYLCRAAALHPSQWFEAIGLATRAADTVALAQDPMRAATRDLNSPCRLVASDDNGVASYIERGDRFATWADKRAQHRFVVMEHDTARAALICVSSLAQRDIEKLVSGFGLRIGQEPPNLLVALGAGPDAEPSQALRDYIFLCAAALSLCADRANGTVLMIPEPFASHFSLILPVHDATKTWLNGWRTVWIDPDRSRLCDDILALLHAMHGQYTERPSTASGPIHAEVVPLQEAEFKRAVIDALRHYTDARRLTHNPIVADGGLLDALFGNDSEDSNTPGDTVGTLRKVLRDTIYRLGNAPRNRRYVLVLDSAYLSPRQQKVAAAELNMAYSTYRRLLHDARQMVAEELWQQKQEVQRQRATAQ